MGQNPGLAEPSSLPRLSCRGAQRKREEPLPESASWPFQTGFAEVWPRPFQTTWAALWADVLPATVRSGGARCWGLPGLPGDSHSQGRGDGDSGTEPSSPTLHPFTVERSPEPRPALLQFVPPPSPAAVGRTWGQGASQAPWPREVTLSRWPELGVGGGRLRPAGPPGAARPGGRPRERVDSWPSGQASWSRGEVARGQPALGRAAGGGVSLPACPTRAPGSLLLSPGQQ